MNKLLVKNVIIYSIIVYTEYVSSLPTQYYCYSIIYYVCVYILRTMWNTGQYGPARAM